MKLNYLFKAEFTDGSSLTQTQEDTSLLDEKRNQFYDVLNSGKELKKLTLYEQKLWNPNSLSVDFQTGNFILNGAEIISEPIIDTKTGKEVTVKRTPIRYYGVKKHFNATYNVKTMKLLDTEELKEDRIFYIGWETKVGEETHKRVIGIK